MKKDMANCSIFLKKNAEKKQNKILNLKSIIIRLYVREMKNSQVDVAEQGAYISP